MTIGLAVFAQVTTEASMGALSPKIAASHGGSGTPSNTIPWAHTSPQPKRNLDRFCRFYTVDRRVSLYFTMGAQNCPFPWGIWTPSNTWVPGPTRVLNPNRISIASVIFARLTNVTDRQTYRPTERPRYSVGNNTSHLRI